MTSNVYGRLGGVNAIGNAATQGTYGGAYSHNNHHGTNAAHPNSHTTAEGNYLYNMQPEDYLGKYIYTFDNISFKKVKIYYWFI